MGWELVCIMVRNISVSERMGKLLIRLACEMLLEHRRRHTFTSDRLECEGTIKTKGQRATLGHFSGTVFEAHLETNRGKAQVHFLVDDRDPADLMLAQEDDLVCTKASDEESDDDAYLNN